MAESLNRWIQTDQVTNLWEVRSFGVTPDLRTSLRMDTLYLSVFHASSTICPPPGSDRRVCQLLNFFFKTVKKILFDGFGVENENGAV